MNLQETTELLAYIRVLEPRMELDEAVVLRWHPLVEDLTLPVAKAAVDLHDRESPVWIKPAHVRACAQRILWADPAPVDEWDNPLPQDETALAARVRLVDRGELTA